tara:strand:+ start:1763 stop:2395 length:633 start_codon:yes stop_codon:yes gene_type:complete
MIEVAQQPLIQRLILQIQNFSPASKIIVVGGYKVELLKKFLHKFDANIDLVINPDYSTTNNMESCRLGLEAAPIGGCIIVNADCVYDDAIVKGMLEQKTSCIAVDSSQYFKENMKVRVDKGTVTKISKDLDDALDIKTSIDIYYFTELDRRFLHKIMLNFNHNNDLNQWTEVAIDRLVSEQPVSPKEFRGNKWMEIDNLGDLDIAQKLFA